MRTHARWLVGIVLPLLLAACNPEPIVGWNDRWSVDFGGEHLTFPTASPQTVPNGSVFSVFVTANEGFTLDDAVTGSCPRGTWTGETYSTGPIVSSCDVRFSATQVVEPPPVVHTVIATAGANGTIAPQGSTSVPDGGSQTFTATPDATFVVREWILDGTAVQTGGATFTLSDVTRDHTVEVTFNSNTLPFNVVPVAGANGSVSPNTSQTVVGGGSVTFTATPDAGFSVAIWQLDGVLAQTGGATYTLTNIQANHTVTVSFSAVMFNLASTAGPNGAISPAGTQTVPSGSSAIFTATPDSGYVVNQWLVDGSLVQTGGSTFTLNNVTADHTVAVSFGNASVVASVTELAVSIVCTPSSSCASTQSDALTGNARQILFTNVGSLAANNVSILFSNLPGGTVANTTCGSNLAPGSICSVTLTPGATASADTNGNPCTVGTAPVASTVSFTSDNGNASSVNAFVLGYGCQYQGGFLFSVDDTTPTTGSIGGKVMSQVDQAAPYTNAGEQLSSVRWSSDASGGITLDIIPLLQSPNPSDHAAAQSHFDARYSNAAAFPFPPPVFFSSCNGLVDGACSSNNITAFYNQFRTFDGAPPILAAGPTAPNTYAAGLCRTSLSGYSDWYLPAPCELDAASPCPANVQAILGNLPFLIGDMYAPTPDTSCAAPTGTQCLAGFYWSSAQFSPDPANQALVSMLTLGGSNVTFASKQTRAGVRCVRGLTL